MFGSKDIERVNKKLQYVLVQKILESWQLIAWLFHTLINNGKRILKCAIIWLLKSRKFVESTNHIYLEPISLAIPDKYVITDLVSRKF